MRLESLRRAEPFVTKDGSTIRELHHTDLQSLAEATLEPGQATQRHHHRATEEIYLVTKGSGELEVDGERRHVRPGDAVLIPPRCVAHARERRDERAHGPLRVLAALRRRRHVLRVSHSTSVRS